MNVRRYPIERPLAPQVVAGEFFNKISENFHGAIKRFCNLNELKIGQCGEVINLCYFYTNQFSKAISKLETKKLENIVAKNTQSFISLYIRLFKEMLQIDNKEQSPYLPLIHNLNGFFYYNLKIQKELGQ